VAHTSKVVLNCISGNNATLGALVERFLTEGVKYVAVAGVDCVLVEDLIDELVVGDGSDENRYILTSSHPSESLEAVIAFARTIAEGESTDPQIIEI
jgi:hypothetical protein